MAKKEGEPHQLYKHYTKEEKQFILENWARLSDNELAVMLGRTEAAIKQYRQAHGLVRKTWSRRKKVNVTINNPKVEINIITLVGNKVARFFKDLFE